MAAVSVRKSGAGIERGLAGASRRQQLPASCLEAQMKLGEEVQRRRSQQRGLTRRLGSQLDPGVCHAFEHHCHEPTPFITWQHHPSA
jgi:hypothetical protein